MNLKIEVDNACENIYDDSIKGVAMKDGQEKDDE